MEITSESAEGLSVRAATDASWLDKIFLSPSSSSSNALNFRGVKSGLPAKALSDRLEALNADSTSFHTLLFGVADTVLLIIINAAIQKPLEKQGGIILILLALSCLIITPHTIIIDDHYNQKPPKRWGVSLYIKILRFDRLIYISSFIHKSCLPKYQ